MNTLTIVIFACVAVVALADNYYQPGFRHVKNGIAAVYNNADRQKAVNYRAEHIGRSSGTARWYGVPGTGRNFGYGYDHQDNYGHDSHDSYGQDSYGHDNYGHDNYGYNTYENDRRGYH